MGLSLDEIDPPLDDIAFLSRSNHRVDVLTELARDERTRRDLRETTGVSRPTLGRVLDGFQERGWISNEGREYALTPLGRLLVEEFSDLMNTVETIQELSELAPRLPLEELDFDLRLLAEARITTPSPTDATAHVRREEELAECAKNIRFFCNSAHPHTVKVYRDRVVEDGQQLEAIIAGEAMDAASDDPEMEASLQDLLASERTTIYRYDGIVPVMVGLLDDTAIIQPLDDAGIPCALIETDNRVIRTWVKETIDSHQSEAEKITIDIPPN